MKPGDLYRIRVNATCPWRGRIVMIIGEKIAAAGDTKYVKCFCDGVRMIPTYWLQGLDETR